MYLFEPNMDAPVHDKHNLRLPTHGHIKIFNIYGFKISTDLFGNFKGPKEIQTSDMFHTSVSIVK